MLARRLFVSGLITMCLFACAHFGGFLQAAYAARHDPGMAELTRAMRAQRTNLLGFEASILDFREYFSANFSILMLLAGVLGLVVLSIVPEALQPVVISRLSVLYGVAMVLLFGTSVFFSVFQGVVTCVFIGALFGAAWWLSRGFVGA
jgi:hypothetical protein